MKKFTDRNTAVSRIWKAILELGSPGPSSGEAEPVQEALPPTVHVEPNPIPTEVSCPPEAAQEPTAAAQAADVAAPELGATDETGHSKRRRSAAPKAQSPRAGSKATTILELLKRKGGVTLKALMDATGWQAHSVRGFLSGTISKKLGLTVLSVKRESGDRTYSIQA